MERERLALTKRKISDRVADRKQLAKETLCTNTGGIVIIFGLILLLIGFVTGIPIVWTIGMIVLVVGLVLWVLGSMGRAVGGRKHYY